MKTNLSGQKAYIITGPTSGIARCTALELAKRGTVVLVGRDRRRLDGVQQIIEQKGQKAVSVVCDLSELASVRRAAAEIIALQLPIAGLLNNAGIMQARPIVTGNSVETGTYYDHNGQPMAGSVRVRDPKFQECVVAETRALLAAVPA